MSQFIVFLIAASAFAAHELDGPSLGAIFDPSSKSIRRLSGLPGSLRNELNVKLGDDTVAAWISPDSSIAVIARSSGKLERRNLLTGESDSLEGPLPSDVLFSSNSKRIGLWWKNEQRFALWGQAEMALSAKAIVVPDQGEVLILESDGLLRNASGAGFGNHGPLAVIAERDGRLVVASSRAWVVFDQKDSNWALTSRLELDSDLALRQIVVQSRDAVLAVGSDGSLARWQTATGTKEGLAETGVVGLRALRQSGFYFVEGDAPQILFTLSPSQKLYLLPAIEVAQ